jgi:hypothetical protein
LNYNNYNKSEENDDVTMSQRSGSPRPIGLDRQQSPRDGFPGAPSGLPNTPPPDDFFDDDQFDRLPPGFRPRPPQGPPPNIPGGIPTPPSFGGQQQFRYDQPGFPRQFWQIDPRGIRRCLYRYTYVWLRNGASFWFFPVFVSDQTVIGFRWRQRNWEYFSLNFRRVSYFRCF